MTITIGFQPSHPDHELELKDYKKPYTCDGCKEQGFGLRYRCEQCNYDLHEDCAFNTETTCHEFFKGFTFKFSYQPPKSNCDKSDCPECKTLCNACGKTVNGFFYHSDDKVKSLDLHPCCMNLKKKLCVDGVKFRLRDKVVSKCLWCNKKTIKGSCSDSKTRGWSYVSKCDKYLFHVCCATDMVLEGWKTGDNEHNRLMLDKSKLPLWQKFSTRNGGKGSKYWRIAKILLTTIAGILLGDPTIILTTLACNLLSN